MTTRKTAAFLTTGFLGYREEYNRSGEYSGPLGVADVIQGIPSPTNEDCWYPFLRMLTGTMRFDYVYAHLALANSRESTRRYPAVATVYLELARKVVKEDGSIILVTCACDTERKRETCNYSGVRISRTVTCWCNGGNMDMLLHYFLSTGRDDLDLK